jgi:hypothetical protein
MLSRPGQEPTDAERWERVATRSRKEADLLKKDLAALLDEVKP